MRYQLLTLLLPLGLLSGCLHAGVPMRSAHMPADGAWRLGINITLPGWDFEHGMNVRSGAAPMMMVPMPVFLLGLLDIEVGHTINRTECIAHMGISALGGEVRQGLSAGDHATALEVAAMWRPVAKSDHPHVRLGMSGTRDRLLYGAHLSYGPEPHSEPIIWGKFLNAESPLAFRLTGVIGGYFELDEGDPLLALGAAPYLSWTPEDASWGGGAQPLMGLDLASDRAE